MEVYVLDSLLRRTEVIDRFESLIWTERWASWGDFQLVIRSTYENRSRLKKGTQLAMNRSYRVMTVITVEDVTDQDGKKVLKVKGRSLEAIFDERVAKATMSNLTTEPTWNITDVPAAIVRKLVHDICVTDVLDPVEKRNQIPFLIEGRHPLVSASTITEPLDPITVKLEPQSLYEAMTKLCDTWTMGFRLLLNFDASQLYFDVYTGVDRTSSQTTQSPVIFSPELDNLQNTSELNTIDGSKNVAYVFAANGYMEVFAANVDPDTDGFERRVLVVNASDITLPSGAAGSAAQTALDSAMLQRGKEALAEHREFQAFDGEINQQSQYLYGKDYSLGDLVEIRNTDGEANQMRVTEQIFVSDHEGERTYPTLALNTFVSTGSWISYTTKSWIDYDTDTTTTWSTLP